MQTQLNKSKKFFIDTRHEYKANKTSFTILSLSIQKFYIKPFSDRAYANILTTLTNSRKTYEQVAPLETKLHKESRKIWFGIFRAIYK